MISEKSSNRFRLSLLAAVALFSPSCVFAQDAGYTPPPMFEDMTPPMVRPETQNGYIVEPKASVNPQLPTTPLQRPTVAPRVSVDPDSPRPAVQGRTSAPPVLAPEPQKTPVQPIQSAPVTVPAPAVQPPMSPAAVPAPPVAPSMPPKPAAPVVPQAPAAAPAPKPKMMEPIIEETYIKRERTPAPVAAPATKPSITIPAAPKKPEAPAQGDDDRTAPAKAAKTAKPVAAAPQASDSNDRTQPVRTAPPKRDPSESAIKGPKTMPALPTQNVDGEVLFEDKAAEDQTIFERHQAETSGEKIQPIIPAPNPSATPASFDMGDQGVLKKSLSFQPGQIGLEQTQADSLAAGIVKELDGDDKEDWRVQIKAFATPHGTGLSSDRRIALSRGLSLRSTLITQGVPANRIDVLAEGLQTEGSQPGDRIDVYLYGPKKR